MRFSTISVRSFDRTVGDHPCCEGSALSLDWEYCQLPEVTVDMYESKMRKPLGRKLFPWERRKILSCWPKVEMPNEQIESAHGASDVYYKILKLLCHKS